jgi:1-deoxy-D-xylulose-5-phosphate synthase
MKYKILDDIHKPSDLKKLSFKDLDLLAVEIRHYMVEVTSETGGHLASSLGAVEIAIALHRVFNTPEDKIIWDVGHQAYAHKILTGRKNRFKTLRQYKGLSGFLKPGESKYDVFGAGHTSTAISAALGFAKARDIAGQDFEVVAVLGDASLANGMSLEAINNAGHDKTKMIIVVIDNEMSISPTVGALSNYLNRLMTGGLVNKLRGVTKSVLEKIPGIGKTSVNVIRHIEEGVKGIISPGIIFDELGLRYIGPISGGHNIKLIERALANIKDIKGPKLLHIITKKGKGYEPAERNPTLFHGIGPFDKKTGIPYRTNGAPVYSKIFSETLEKLARNNKKIVAIVAAMIEGTNLSRFRELYPDRFFDVGIAEEHAVTFAGGLAAAGFRPVVAIYSTFMQRGFDQIIHDIGAQKLPVIFAMDRAGLVGEDGATHHGVFDIAFMKMVPNMVVMAPSDETELRRLLTTAVKYKDGPVAIRFPRGASWNLTPAKRIVPVKIGRARLVRRGNGVTIASLGTLLPFVLKAAGNLGPKYAGKIEIIDARFAKPMDIHTMLKSVKKTRKLITLEEGCIEGGFGQSLLAALKAANIEKISVKHLGIPDKFIEHGTMDQLRRDCGLMEEGIGKAILEILH